MVGEPSVEETIEILYGLRERYEKHHKLKISDEALEAAAKLSDRYISDRYLPDKAIDLIDEAGSRVRLINSQLPPAAKELDRELRQVLKEKDDAVRAQNFDKAGELRDREMELKAQIRAIAQQKKSESANGEEETPSLPKRTLPTLLPLGQVCLSASSPKANRKNCCTWRRPCTSGSLAKMKR